MLYKQKVFIILLRDTYIYLINILCLHINHSNNVSHAACCFKYNIKSVYFPMRDSNAVRFFTEKQFEHQRQKACVHAMQNLIQVSNEEPST